MEKTKVNKFIEELLAKQKEREQEGKKFVPIKKDDLLGLIFYEGELILIERKDLENINL